MGKKKVKEYYFYFFYLEPELYIKISSTYEKYGMIWEEELKLIREDIDKKIEEDGIPDHMKDIPPYMYAWTDSNEFASIFNYHRTQGWFKWKKVIYDDYYEYKECLDYLHGWPFKDFELLVQSITGQVVADNGHVLTEEICTSTVLTYLEIRQFYEQWDLVDNQIYELTDIIDTVNDQWTLINSKYTAALNAAGLLDMFDMIYDMSHCVMEGKDGFENVNDIAILGKAFPGLFDMGKFKNYLDVVNTVSR